MVLIAPIVLIWAIFSTLNRLTDVFGASMESGAPSLGPMLERSLGLGVLAMAAIQVVRSVYPVRRLYHEWLLRRWFTPGLRGAPASDAPKTSTPDAYLHFLSIVTASDRRTFLDLPIEQLCGQIAAAGEQVIEQASARRPMSLPTAPQGTDPRELAKLVLYGLAGDTAAGEVGALVKKSDEPSDTPAKDLEDVEYVRLRNAVTLRVQRNIDGLQIWGGLWWRRILRCSAILLCDLRAGFHRGLLVCLETVFGAGSSVVSS